MEYPSEIRAKRRGERDAFIEKLSDRTRTLCLGTIVLVWGILTEKDGKFGIVLTRFSRIALLSIAFSAIIVLTLEFAEYLCALQYRRRLAGEKVWWGIKFHRWEVRMRFTRISLGAITLMALCIVLLWVLAPTVLAKKRPEYPFAGTWCGEPNTKFTCLYISDATPRIGVKIAFSDDNPIGCGPRDGTSDVFKDNAGNLIAECKSNDGITDASIQVSGGPEEDEVMVQFQFKTNGIFGAPETRTLVEQPPTSKSQSSAGND